MSPSRFHIQECSILEIETAMFKRVLQLAFIKYEFGTPNLFKAGSIMSLLYFTVCKLLETWLYICLHAREFLCKCACLRLLWLFAHFFVDNVWKYLNLRVAKWHPVNTESQICDRNIEICVLIRIILYTPSLSEVSMAYFAPSYLTVLPAPEKSCTALILCCSFSHRSHILQL